MTQLYEPPTSGIVTPLPPPTPALTSRAPVVVAAVGGLVVVALVVVAFMALATPETAAELQYTSAAQVGP